jgi:Mlc titration factor MtfA (ptsG expression regulator)
MNPVFSVKLSDFGEGPGLYIALLLILMLAFVLFRALRDGVKAVQTAHVKTGGANYDSEEEAAVDLHLANFLYYRKLSPQGKKEFVQRTLNFIETHFIEGENDFEPGLREKIHVAAAATQLSFGMKDFIFTHFETVILYPGVFRINAGSPLMKGATHPNGLIMISIKDFDAGYANPFDKLNVGLHEFGHALFMELLSRANDEEGSEMLKANLFQYLEVADKILNEGKHRDDFLRDYAFTNRHEFFAVSVEHFFEAPAEFKTALPQLYSTLKALLKQDPASGSPDYGIRRAEVNFS